MEDALAVIAALVLWRLVTSIALATLVAVSIAIVQPSTSPALVTGIVIVGLAVGIVWQSKAESPPVAAQVTLPVSRPVALLGLAFLGLVWGGLVEFATNSAFVALVILLATPFLFSPAVVAVTKRALSGRQLAFGSFAIVSGYVAFHVIHSIVPLPGA
jgi:hypothetical protein